MRIPDSKRCFFLSWSGLRDPDQRREHGLPLLWQLEDELCLAHRGHGSPQHQLSTFWRRQGTQASEEFGTGHVLWGSDWLILDVAPNCTGKPKIGLKEYHAFGSWVFGSIPTFPSLRKSKQLPATQGEERTRKRKGRGTFWLCLPTEGGEALIGSVTDRPWPWFSFQISSF